MVRTSTESYLWECTCNSKTETKINEDDLNIVEAYGEMVKF